MPLLSLAVLRGVSWGGWPTLSSTLKNSRSTPGSLQCPALRASPDPHLHCPTAWRYIAVPPRAWIWDDQPTEGVSGTWDLSLPKPGGPSHPGRHHLPLQAGMMESAYPGACRAQGSGKRKMSPLPTPALSSSVLKMYVFFFCCLFLNDAAHLQCQD